MSGNQQNSNHSEGSSNPSENQQIGGTTKMMTQTEYLKYKQGDSNANNYYNFSKEPTVLPVAWV
jgi:hypothetical protein